MWQMTLKQRRKHGEIISKLDELHRNKYSKVPNGYIFAENPEEDAKYNSCLETLKELLQELHDLEEAVRDR